MWYIIIIFAYFTENLTRCEERSTRKSGMISAPDQNGDGFYDINTDCLWIISAKEGYVIRYRVVITYVEESVDSHKDVLQVGEPRHHKGGFALCENKGATQMCGYSLRELRVISL